MLAVYLLAFQGGLAAGSAFWGGLAERVGIPAALLWAGLDTLATAALGLVARLPDSTADVSPWNHWYLETFIVSSGAERLRQHERVIGGDQKLEERLRQYAQREPVVRHLVYVERDQ